MMSELVLQLMGVDGTVAAWSLHGLLKTLPGLSASYICSL